MPLMEAHNGERHAKRSKNKVTLLACSNVTGTCKPLFIYRSKKPHINMNLRYYSQKKSLDGY